jgi:hypothetical protein
MILPDVNVLRPRAPAKLDENIEAGCEWITTDRDYARFERLRWRAPF